MTVLIALMIITLMLFEFQFGSMLERKLAYNELNQVQAHYLAKGAARVGMLRVALYGRLVSNKSIEKAAQGIPVGQYMEMLYTLPFPPFPPNADSIGELNKADRDAAESLLEQTRISNGQSIHTIRTETNKINVNFLQLSKQALEEGDIDLRRDPKTLQEYVARSLINLMEGFIADSDDPYREYGNFSPEEIVLNLMDWVNPGSNALAGGSKDAYYEGLNPPYQAKRNRFYTIDEVRMVKGISPALFRKLRKYITVYAYDGKININQASGEILRALYADFTEEDIKELLEYRETTGGFATEKGFVSYVSDTLGRSGFAEIYDDPKTYPFTVNATSFIVEGTGQIRKSASVISRSVTVALSLAASKKGGQNETANAKNPTECNKLPGYFWDSRQGMNTCRAKPQDDEECRFELAGTPSEQNGNFCCKLNNIPLICLSEKDTNGPGNADSLKVIYWAET